MAKSNKQKKGTRRTPSHATPLSPEVFFLILLGGLLIGLLLLQTDQFSWLGAPIHFPPTHFYHLLWLGMLLAGAGFFFLPKPDPRTDLPRHIAYPLLGAIILAGAWLRYYRISEPMGRFWDDPAQCIMDPRNVMDLHDFKILFPIGSREPLYTYVAAFVWWIFPAWKAVFVQRFAANLFNIPALWLLYRIGREVSGKRLIGVILAALAAASKPVLLQDLCGMNGLTLTFSVALFLFFQIRLYKKPTLPHFLQWGGVLALGLYTYNAIRTWVPVLALLTVGWILWQKRKEKPTLWLEVAVGLFGLGYLLFFLDKMLSIARHNPVSHIWGDFLWLWVVLNVLFAGIFIYGYLTSKDRGKQLCGWALGLLLAGFLSHPLTLLPDATQRIANISLIPKQTSQIFTAKFADLMVTQVSKAIQAFFLTGEDRGDMNVVMDPFFDFHAAVLVILGLVWTLVRPSWWKTLFFVYAWVGIVPRLLTDDPQSAKLLGALPVLLYMASEALGTWIAAGWGPRWKSRWLGVLLVAGLTVFWAWEIRGTYLRVFENWWYVQSDDVCIAKAVAKELPGHRVFIAGVSGFGYMSPATQGVINDGLVFYLLKDVNSLSYGPDRPLEDVVVYVSPRNKEKVDRLKKDFPKASWSELWQYDQVKGVGDPFSHRVLIPADQVPRKAGKIFEAREVPGKSWLRRVYNSIFGLAKGMVEWEDQSPTLNPLPASLGGRSASAEGIWEAPADGTYTFSVYTPNTVQVWIDDKKVIDFKPDHGAVKVHENLKLSKGPHRVRYLTFLKINDSFADVMIEDKRSGYSKVLGKD